MFPLDYVIMNNKNTHDDKKSGKCPFRSAGPLYSPIKYDYIIYASPGSIWQISNVLYTILENLVE